MTRPARTNPITKQHNTADQTKVTVSPYVPHVATAETTAGKAVSPGEPLKYGTTPVTATKTGKIIPLPSLTRPRRVQ
jgi:hypothetical protein